MEPEQPSGPLSALGALAESIDAATEESRRARTASEQTATELRSEKLWRRWTARIGIGSALVLLAVTITFALLGLFAVLHLDKVLSHIAVDAKSCGAHPNTLGCENHQELLAIKDATGPQAQARSAEQIRQIIAIVVTSTDCNTRKDLAQALHTTMPATASCPAASA